MMEAVHMILADLAILLGFLYIQIKSRQRKALQVAFAVFMPNALILTYPRP